MDLWKLCYQATLKAVDEMLQQCCRGPPDAMVTALKAVPCNEDAGKAFQRRPTV